MRRLFCLHLWSLFCYLLPSMYIEVHFCAAVQMLLHYSRFTVLVGLAHCPSMYLSFALVIACDLNMYVLVGLTLCPSMYLTAALVIACDLKMYVWLPRQHTVDPASWLICFYCSRVHWRATMLLPYQHVPQQSSQACNNAFALECVFIVILLLACMVLTTTSPCSRQACKSCVRSVSRVLRLCSST